MGCLNSDQGFSHWFGNIHLSGPCNRACYFCIGQHMMALDSYDTRDVWPLPNVEEYVDRLIALGINQVYLTGTNTDPLLYKHIPALTAYLRERIPDVVIGLRTNAVVDSEHYAQFDKGSVTICSFDPATYKKMMGRGAPPNIYDVVRATSTWSDLKVNVVLGPENTGDNVTDLLDTLHILEEAGVNRVNLREPYGQPHIGDPLRLIFDVRETTLGMPTYWIGDMKVTWWDVHYVEVESLNLYASGRISTTYPISKGHADSGIVLPQANFEYGRHNEQWTTEVVG